MTEPTVQHATIVIERNYDATPARVFAAFADPAERAQWHVPGDDWEVTEHEHNFRVGGSLKSRFGPKGAPVYFNDGVYLDIVPDARIISAGTMHSGETPTSTTLCTVELLADGAGTRLILTDQSAFLDGHEEPADRKTGWGAILDKLDMHLQ